MKKKLFVFLVVTVLLFGLTPVQAVIPGEDVYQPDADYCELVSEQDIIEGGHIQRLHQEETEPNTAVYLNEDGTNTMYIFSQDVWYKDANGVKHNYTSNIEESSTPGISYEAIQGSKCFTLSTKASNGVRYSENGYAVTMFPSNDRVINGAVVMANTNEEPNEVLNTEEPIIEESVEISEEPAIEEITEEPVIEETVPEITEPVEEAPVTEEVTETTEEVIEEPVEIPEEPAIEEITEEPVTEEITEEPVIEEELTDLEVIEKNIPFSEMEENIIEEEEETLLTLIAPLFEGNAQLQTIENPENGLTKNAVTYANTFSNMDYTVIPVLHGFQNQMTVRNANTDNKFSFRIYLENVVPGNSQGDNIPLFNNQGKMVMQINAETLRDANGVYIPGSTIDIAPYGNGYYLVTVTLSQDISQIEDLEYPLTATSSVITTVTAALIYDTCVCSGTPTQNYGTSPNLTVGKATGPTSLNPNGSVWRAFLQYHISNFSPTIKPNSIISATPQFYPSSSNDGTATILPRIPGLLWDAQTLTWTNVASKTMYSRMDKVNAPNSFSMAAAAYSGGEGKEFFSALMREYLEPDMVRSIKQNRGLVLMTSEEQNDVHYINSANSSQRKPRVAVEYYPDYCMGNPAYSNIATTSTDINCLGFACDIDEFVNPSHMGSLVPSANSRGYYNNAVKPYLQTKGKTVIDVNNYNSYISTTKRRVAMRSTGPGIYWSACYHFWVETGDGHWAHKDSDNPSELITSTDNPNDNVAEWFVYDDQDGAFYFDSETIYFSLS